jgi:hypothetical protein
MAEVTVTGTVKSIEGPPMAFVLHIAEPPPDGIDRAFLTDEPIAFDVVKTAYGAGKPVHVKYDDGMPAKATKASSP